MALQPPGSTAARRQSTPAPDAALGQYRPRGRARTGFPSPPSQCYPPIRQAKRPSNGPNGGPTVWPLGGMADAGDLKSLDREIMSVRVRQGPPTRFIELDRRHPAGIQSQQYRGRVEPRLSHERSQTLPFGRAVAEAVLSNTEVSFAGEFFEPRQLYQRITTTAALAKSSCGSSVDTIGGRHASGLPRCCDASATCSSRGRPQRAIEHHVPDLCSERA